MGADFLDKGFEQKTTDTGFFVSTAIYSLSDGAPLTALQANKNIQSKVTVKREIEGTQTVTVVCALINDKNSIEKMSYVTDTLGNGQEKTLRVNLTLPGEIKSGSCLKTFVWDSLQGQWSYCEGSRFPETKIINSAWKMSDENVMYTSDEEHSGYSSLKFRANSFGEASQDISVDPRNYYIVGFYAKGNSPFTYSILDQNKSVMDSKTFGSSANWIPVSIPFNSAGNSEITFRLANNSVSGAVYEAVYMDDVFISKNHILNNGFEGEMSLSWELGADGIITNETPLADTFSLKLKGTNLGEAYQLVNVINGGDYLLSFQAKTVSGNNKVCRVYPNAYMPQYVEIPIDGAVGTVKKYTLDLIPTANVMKIAFVTGGISSGVTYIDNVDLSMTPSNLLINPGFEEDDTISSTVNDYSLGWTARSSGKMTRVDEPNYPNYVRSGSYAARLSNRSDNWSAMAQSVLEQLKRKGKGTYYFECYVKTGKGTSGTLIAKLDMRIGTTKTIFQGTVVGKDSEWTKIAFTANVTSVPTDGSLKAAWIYIESGESDTNKKFEYYADDFLFEKR